MSQQGAELAFTYQNERLKKNLEKISEELGHKVLIECDVSSDQSIEDMIHSLEAQWEILMV